MQRYRVFVLSALLIVSCLVITSQSQAAVQVNTERFQNRMAKGVVFVSREALLRIAKSSGLKVHSSKFIRLSKADMERLSKSASEGCGCASAVAEEEGGGGWDCFVGCLSSWGIPATATWACAVTCSTGGAYACIACLGTAEWIVLGCGQWCAWKPLITKNSAEKPLTHKLRGYSTRSAQIAKLSSRASRLASSR